MRTAASALSIIVTLTAAPFAGSAQESGKIPRIGYVRSGSFADDPYRESFLRGMRDLGWVDGRNIVIEFRNYGDDHRKVVAVIDELVRTKVQALVVGGTPAVRAATAATRTIPIIMGATNDPLGSGFIQSLARPGGNVTGLALLGFELTAKRLELLKEIAPQRARVAILQNPDNSGHGPITKDLEVPARSLGHVIRPFEARRAEDFHRAFVAMREWPSDAVIALDDAAFIANRTELAAQAARQRLPLVCGFREMVEAGCFLSYAVSLADMWYRSAGYVDKILKGTNPADLPVEQGSKFQLTISLKTAKAIGVAVPESFLLRADEVIE
jgi:putative ABC transport system substrate-binding protein